MVARAGLRRPQGWGGPFDPAHEKGPRAGGLNGVVRQVEFVGGYSRVLLLVNHSEGIIQRQHGAVLGRKALSGHGLTKRHALRLVVSVRA